MLHALAGMTGRCLITGIGFDIWSFVIMYGIWAPGTQYNEMHWRGVGKAKMFFVLFFSRCCSWFMLTEIESRSDRYDLSRQTETFSWKNSSQLYLYLCYAEEKKNKTMITRPLNFPTEQLNLFFFFLHAWRVSHTYQFLSNLHHSNLPHHLAGLALNDVCMYARQSALIEKIV